MRYAGGNEFAKIDTNWPSEAKNYSNLPPHIATWATIWGINKLPPEQNNV